MSDRDEIERPTLAALDGILSSFGTEAGEYGADLFVAHHLGELEPSYWIEQLGTDAPDPEQVLGLLVPLPPWSSLGDEDAEECDVFDFTLPGGVTNYVLSVRFDKDGGIEEISVES